MPCRKRLSLLFSLLLPLFFVFIGAQPNDILFKHLSLKEGFAQTPVFSFLQDKKGFIWIGSRGGLIRFDGYEFKKFTNRVPQKQNAVYNDVRALYEDNNQILWVGTSVGLYSFDRKTEQFTSLNFPDAPTIHALQSDASGSLWVATTKGLECINTTTRQKINLTAFPSFAQVANRNINALLIDQKKKLWIGLDSGMVCINLVNKHLAPLPPALQKNQQLLEAKVYVIRQDRDGDFWMGTEDNGLFGYAPKEGVCTNYSGEMKSEGFPSNFVRDILVYDSASIWIGTRDGLSVLHKTTHSFTNYRHESTDPGSLSHSAVLSFLKDDADNIWIGTYAGGLNVYHAANANFRNIGEQVGATFGLSEPLVNAVLPDPAGNIIWAGTDGGGLNRIDRQNSTATYYPVKSGHKFSNVVKALTWDKNQNIILGTLDGLALFNPKTTALSYFHVKDEKAAKNFRVNAVYTDATGIWAGTERNGLLHVIDDNHNESFVTNEARNSISDNRVTAVSPDNRGNLWVATRNGLNYFDKQQKTFQRFYIREQSDSNAINAVYLDSRQLLWVGTSNGIYCFSKTAKQFYALTNTVLGNPQVQSITEDAAGKLWVSTSLGLSCITLKNTIIPFTNSSAEVVNYTANDGLASNQFLLGAVARVSNELIFGGVNGITTFYPGSIVKNSHPPKVVVTELLVHNQSVQPGIAHSPLLLPIEDTKQITLNYNQGDIAFRFAALNFLNSQNNQYAYKMEGLSGNEEWQYAGHQRTANYTNLEPGHYIFHLKAANNDGVWSTETVAIAITVLPPFWKTWWAYTLYAILFVAAMFVIVRFFRKRAKLERDLYYEHLLNQRQEELHQMKLDLFTNISHEIKTPLTLISGPLEELIRKPSTNMAATQQHLALMKNNTERLMRLVTELLDFRKAETGHMQLYVGEHNLVAFLQKVFAAFSSMAANLNIDYQFKKTESEASVFFDEYQLEKVVFNLLANAFKFTPEGGSIQLSVIHQNNKTGFSVMNTGIGIPKEKQAKLFTNFYQAHEHYSRNIGSGIGLALSKSIVELHKGTIFVESGTSAEEENGKTCFTVLLQTGAAHFQPEELVGPGISESIVPNSISIPTVHSDAAAKDENAAEKRYTILVVEDNDDVRNFITTALATEYKIVSNNNGKIGWETATELIPDLVISDVMMPEMDGFELCQLLKTDERTSHIPVILLTARAAQEHHIHGLETGADIYLVKPFSIQVLELNIRNLRSSREKLQQKFSRLIKLEPTQKIIDLPDERFLNKMLLFIEQNIDNEEFGVPMLASEACMSQPVLYKKIKALTDLSVNDFIKTIRLKKAAQLLEQKQFTVYEVAYMVGYNDSKYFSREFSKQYGKTPTAYVNSLEDIV